MEIILILFVLFVILPTVGGWLLRAWLRHRFNRFNREAGNQETYSGTGKTTTDSRKNRQKVFTQEDGEYVDYEEIKSSNEPPKTPPA